MIVPVAFSLFEGVKARFGIKTKQAAGDETPAQ
jgi:hypothetical protein